MGFTIQDVFNKFGDKYTMKYQTSYNRLDVYNNIRNCKTKEMGIRIYKCSDCGKKIYTYKSCMDRHCPTCLEYKKEVWIEKHKEDILNIKYYHIVLYIFLSNILLLLKLQFWLILMSIPLIFHLFR